MKKFETFLLAFAFALMIISFIGLVCLGSIGIVDSLTVKVIGEESVPCIDEYNRPFENELCTKKITCSYLGAVGDKRCKDVNVLEDES